MTAMSPACLPPVQPATSADERAHPRYAEYASYRAQLSAQLVTAPPFSSWLREREELEKSRAIVFETLPGAWLPAGWYVNLFRAGSRNLLSRLGPYAAQDAAAGDVPIGFEVIGVYAGQK